MTLKAMTMADLEQRKRAARELARELRRVLQFAVLDVEEIFDPEHVDCKDVQSHLRDVVARLLVFEHVAG